MNNTNNAIVNAIEENKVIVIIRRIYGDNMLRLCEALAKGGIGLIEVTFDQSDKDCETKTAEAIGMINRELSGKVLAGAGTVLSKSQVDAAAAAGAKYIISPNTNTDVIKHTKEKGLVSMPGAMTPSEIIAAHEAGADFVKVFPAIDLGLGYIKNIKGPISHVKLVATAGINEENFADYLSVGYVGAGISGRLTDKKLIDAGNWDEFTSRAAAFMKIAREFKENR